MPTIEQLDMLWDSELFGISNGDSYYKVVRHNRISKINRILQILILNE